jgi:ubiquinone/menaquinone biosynthesis C-methylase UbiE
MAGAFDGQLMQVYITLFESMQPCWDLIGDKLALENEGEGMTILDLGAGPGEPTCTLAKKYPKAKFVCTDFSGDMVEKAKGRTEKKEVQAQCEFAQCSIADLSAFKDETYDAVVMANSFQFLPPDQREQGCKEIFRVLKSGGKIGMCHWLTMAMPMWAGKTMMQTTGQQIPPNPAGPLGLKDKGALEALMESAGFEKLGEEEIPVTITADKDNGPLIPMILMKEKMTDFDDDMKAKFQENVVAVAKEMGILTEDGNYVASGISQATLLKKP